MGSFNAESHQDLEASAQVGEVLAGKYRVDRVLGVGGMGVVVAARHLQLGQLVALKFIRREALTNLEIVGRFEREARAAVRLKSEHVARIIDVGTLDTGSPYIVMEYLEGQDVAVLLQQYGKLVVPLACDVIIQACDAIAEAHRLGIVHRDLKPANLFLANGPHGQQIVKVLDFGISKVHAATGDASATRTQAVMGSPGYMSPEQMRSSKNVDGRSDVWSLGVILYELVAGHVPFEAETFTALCLKIAMDPLPPLPPLPVVLPAGFVAVVQRALEKDAALRYQSAAELAQALAPFANPQARELAQRLVDATLGPAMSGAHLLPTTAGVSTWESAAGQPQAARTTFIRRSRPLAVMAVGLIAAAAIGLGVGMTRGGAAQDAANQPISPAPVAIAPAPVAPVVIVPRDASPVPDVVPVGAPADAGSANGHVPPAPPALVKPGSPKRATGKGSSVYDNPE